MKFKLPSILFRGEYGKKTDSSPVQTRSSATFVEEKEVAQQYATNPNNPTDVLQEPRVFAARLSITNPFVNQTHPFVSLATIRDKMSIHSACDASIQFAEAIESTNTWQELYKEKYDNPYRAYCKGEVDLEDLYFCVYELLDKPHWVRALRNYGYDGAIYGGSGASAKKLEYRVFDPSQIILVGDQ